MGWLRRLARRAVSPLGGPAPAGGDSAAAWPGPLADHFELTGVLGRGGYSVVYEARRLADGRRYALKVTDLSALTDWSRQAAVREARLLAALAGSHPCLATYREAFCLGSRLCIVTDPASGGDLKRLLLQRGGGLEEAAVWSVFLQVALALQHLHAHCVLHRDVKPANVLLESVSSSSGGGGGWVARLTDLGVCGQLSAVFTRKEAGTPQYKAPEMWRGEAYSFSSDMWALGCLLVELCTGKLLFEVPPGCADAAAVDAAVRSAVLALQQAPRLPAGYSEELQGLLTALLRPLPAQRPSADELLALPAVAARLRHLPPTVQACLPGAAPARQQQQQQQQAASAAVPPSFDASAVNACMPAAAYPGGRSKGLLVSVQPPSPQPQQQQRRLVWAGRGRPSKQEHAAARSRDSSAGSDGSAALSVTLDSLDLAMLSSTAPAWCGGGSLAAEACSGSSSGRSSRRQQASSGSATQRASSSGGGGSGGIPIASRLARHSSPDLGAWHYCI